MRDLDATAHYARLPGSRRGGSAGPGAIALAVARHLDVALVLVAAAPAIVLGAPALGYAIGAVAWIVQSVLAHADRRLIDRAAEPGKRFGLSLFEAFGRIWLLAGAIVVAGVAGGRADGLTAAVVIFCAYSIAFALKVIAGRPGQDLPAAGAQEAKP